MSYAGLPQGFTVRGGAQAQPYAGLPEGFQVAPPVTAPQSALGVGQTSPIDWMADKIAPVISGIPGVGSSDERANYQTAKKIAGLTNWLPLVGAPQQAYQAEQNAKGIMPALSRGDFGVAARDSGVTAMGALATALSVFPGKTGQAVGKVADALASAPGVIGSSVSKIAAPFTAATRAAPLVEALRATAPVDYQKASAAATGANISASQNAGLVSALREAPSRSVPDMGATALPSQIGAPLQKAALANQESILAQRASADAELRSARDAIVQQNEKSGVTIDSTPAYKQLVDTLKPIVAPDLATAPTIRASTDPAVAKVYQRLWDTVVNKDVPLTPEQAAAAKAQGIAVNETRTAGDGPTIVRDGVETPPSGSVKYSRTFKTSFDAVDDARRFLGQVFSGRPPEGYEAITGGAQSKLYGLLSQIEKEYAGKAQTDLQDAYSKASGNLDVFDTKAGKTLTATQGDSGVLNTPAANIPTNFFGQGADKYQQLVDVTGNPDLVRHSADTWLATLLAKTNPQSATALGNMTSPGSKLADMLSHPDLAELRAKALAHSNDLGMADVAAAGTKQQLGDAQRAATAAESAAGTAQKQLAVNYDRMQRYNQMASRDIVAAAQRDISSDFKNGVISQQEYDSRMAQVNQATKMYGQTDAAVGKIKKIAIGAAILGASSQLPRAAHYVLP